ncbi:hypothetical protein ABKN59_010555 [Abortiporus biennis]
MVDHWRLNSEQKPSTIRFWHGLKNAGDGKSRGSALDASTMISPLERTLTSIGHLEMPTVRLSRRAYHYIPRGSERAKADSKYLSRLDIMKQAFEAFVNKSEAFDYPVALGLVTFGKEVKEVQKLTLLKEAFRDSVRSVSPDGDTPLFDSLAVAHSMLESFKRENPSATLRVICLTDGDDVGSHCQAWEVTAKLQRSKVIVDSLIVQNDGGSNLLHAISVATGGYSFKINDLENALNIVELETVLRSRDRVHRPPKELIRNRFALVRFQSPASFPYDVVTSEKCPLRKPHARIHEPLHPAHAVVAGIATITLSSDRQRRLMQEVRDVINSPHPAFDVYVGDDLAFWKIVIEAPSDSPYAGGTFLAYVDFSEEYPKVAPEVRFITPILHPNINRHGKVCHAALDRSWLMDMTMSVILSILYGLLLTPDIDNPLDLHATMEYNDDTGQHALKVHEMVTKFAMKSRSEWRMELES